MDNTFKCLICKTFTTGSVAYQEHLMGSKHQKKLNNLKATKSLAPYDFIEASEDINTAFPFACETCNKKFTGKEPYEQHLHSAAHVKKVQTENCSGNAFPFTCEICAKNLAPLEKATEADVGWDKKYRPEDIRCYGVDEPLGEDLFPSTWRYNEIQELADKEFLASLRIQMPANV